MSSMALRAGVMRRQKPSSEAEQKYQADVALAAQRAELLDSARKAESRLRQAQARQAPVAEIRRLAKDLDAGLTAAMQAAYAAQRAEIGPRGYDDRIYRRKAKAKPGVHALTAEAERLLTLRETHRLNGIPGIAFKPGPLTSLVLREGCDDQARMPARRGASVVSADGEGAPSRPGTARVSLPTRFSASEVAAYILRPDVVKFWLGSESELTAEVGSRAQIQRAKLADRGLVWDPEPTCGVVTSCEWRGGLFELVVSWDGVNAADAPYAGVRIRVTPRPDGGSYVRIRERGIEAGPRALYAALRVWQGALNRLDRLLSKAFRVRGRTRQALIVVHGIGEQRPGQTLRRFVSAVFPDTEQDVRFTKPDYVSPLFDMRIVTVPGRWSDQRPTTDVYELYWAHLIRDTTVGQVYGWAGRLLLAPNRNLPRTLVKHIWAVRALVVAAVVAAGWLAASGTWASWSAALAIGALAVVPGVFWTGWRLARDTFVLGFAGDAARYLEPRPGNIQRRQEVREAGVDLLDALHDSGRYDRIIVFGHSLGSVIAYDILSYAWTRRSRKHDSTGFLSSQKMLAVEDLLNPRTDEPDMPAPEVVRARVSEAWLEYRANGFDWLVSDLVTAGSPLAHARWLLNLDKRTSFDMLVAERSFPTCPPQTETQPTASPGRTRQAFTFTHTYAYERRGQPRSVQVPHHAGLFAVTRWANLYFPLSGVMRGDPVGGPLRDTFGSWVQDIALPQPGGGLLGFAHNLYVDPQGDGAHVARLREALALPVHIGLGELSPEGLSPSVLT